MHLILVAISVCAGLLYCWKYWHYKSPPNKDFISCIVLSTMGLSIAMTVPFSFSMGLGLFSLLMDIFADLYMDVNNLTASLILFSWGHFIRQIAFVYSFHYNSSVVLLLLTGLLVLAIMAVSISSPYKDLKIEKIAQIIIYTLIVITTIWNVSISKESYIVYVLGLFDGKLSIGLTLFSISDLIIVYELVWDKIYIRQIRILLAPILFWIAELRILYELLY